MQRCGSLLLAVLFLWGSSAWAQTIQWEVLSDVQPVSADDPLALTEAAPGELERFTIELNSSPLFEGRVRAGDPISVALPTGQREFRVSRVEEFVAGTRSVAAGAQDGTLDVIALTFTNGSAIGYISSREALFHINGDVDATFLKRMDPAEIDELQCGLDHDHEIPVSMGAGRASLEHAMSQFHMPSLMGGLDDPITIDLLVLYTAKAQTWSESPGQLGIAGIIAQSFNLSQLALDNSAVNITLRLVHSQETNYDETGVFSSTHLHRLTASDDFNPFGPHAEGFMLEAHTLRDQHGADLVTLFAELSDVGGIAWLLNSIGGSPQWGFSVNRVQQIATGYTLVHEIGHNMGSHHGRDQGFNKAGPGGGIFEYATGWRFQGPNGSYATVMSYGRAGDVWVPQFSNPDVMHDGTATGSMTGEFAPANNARSMRETKRVIASYRSTIVAPPIAGVSGAGLSVQTANNGTATRSLSVSNTSAPETSSLVWSMDLFNTTPAQASNTTQDFEYVGVNLEPEDTPAPSGNLSPSAAIALEQGAIMIYETTFNAADGFTEGSHGSTSGWTGSSTLAPVSVSTIHPSVGSQHLRLPATAPMEGVANFYSTFFGPWPSGAYEFSMDFSVSATAGSSYFIMLQDSRTGAVVAGLFLQNRTSIFTYDGAFGETGRTWAPGVYRRVTITIDPLANLARYAIDGQEVITRPILPGTSFGRVWIQRSSGSGGDYLDIDNVAYFSAYRGLPWLRSDLLAGAVDPGGQQSVTLTYRGDLVDPGHYSADVDKLLLS
ncbi:hypothetical protein BH23ACT11_BH23ACT11_15430 [soil metagenome]